MNLHPYDPSHQRLKTDVSGVNIDRVFAAHFQVAAASAPAASAAGVLALTNLGAEAQVITTGIASPAVPRGLSIVSNKSNAAGNVVIAGTNYAGEAITETLAINGTTTRDGAKAYKTVTSVTLPAQTNTPVAQVETATAAGTVTTAGNATVVVTAAGMTGTPKTIAVAVVENDDAAAIAGKIRTALAADAAVSALFTVSGATTAIILTRKTPAANDATLNIAIADGTSVGVTTAASSANTTAGVDYDKVSVGWNDKLGLPFKLAHNTVIAAALNNAREATAPTVVTSATAFESNTVDLHSALAGQVVDVYLLA